MPQDETVSEAEVLQYLREQAKGYFDGIMWRRSDKAVATLAFVERLTAAAQVREIDWKTRAAEIRTMDGDELTEIYNALGISGQFSAVDEIKRLQAAAQLRGSEEKLKRHCAICDGTGCTAVANGYVRCYGCGGSGFAHDNYEHPPTEPDSGPDVLGERKGEE